MLDKIKMLIATSRPVSWVNTAYPFAVGYLIASQSADAVLIVGTLFFLVPYNLVLYGVNDVFDYESDMNNPRKGGVEGAVTPKKFHPIILWTSVLLSLPFVVVLILEGNTVSNVTLALVMFFVLAYSAKGLRFKEVPILDSITSSLHFVGPLIYALSFFSFPVGFWPYVVAFFLWGMASHAFGAVQDIVPDTKAGIHSIATVFGPAATVKFSGALYFFASVILITQRGQALIIGFLGLVYVINVLPYINVSLRRSSETNRAWKRFLKINYLMGAIVTMALLLRA